MRTEKSPSLICVVVMVTLGSLQKTDSPFDMVKQIQAISDNTIKTSGVYLLADSHTRTPTSYAYLYICFVARRAPN